MQDGTEKRRSGQTSPWGPCGFGDAISIMLLLQETKNYHLHLQSKDMKHMIHALCYLIAMAPRYGAHCSASQRKIEDPGSSRLYKVTCTQGECALTSHDRRL
jgi:hypothetical protein